jgi:hypothetical protein
MDISFEPESLEEKSHVREYGLNNSFIDWHRWAGLTNIKPKQAALLLHHIDPDKHQNNNDRDNELSNRHGKLTNDEYCEIASLTQWLESRAPLWTLVDLVETELVKELGDYYVPSGMIRAIEESQQTEAASNAGMTKPTKNQQRDEDYKSWLEETNLDIDDMTKADIQAALIPRNRTLWTSGFNDWVKHTALYAGRRGRKLG